MNILTLEVAGERQRGGAADGRLLDAMHNRKRVGAFISFPTVQALWTALSPSRWDILCALRGAGPLPMHEVARLVNRDLEGVLADTRALQAVGVLDALHGNVVELPYDAVHVNFTVSAAG